MTIWTDLKALVEAEIVAQGYLGTLEELGINQPYEPKLITLLELQAKLAEITATGGGGGSGDASAANQTTQITAANLANTRIGDLSETAPANDTANSGLNGRLQRIAQRLTSLLALLPASLGIKNAAGSLSIAPASDAVFTVSQAAVTPAFLFTSTITRAANTTAYTANDVYGGAFELISSPAPTAGQWVIITDIEIIFNIAALPSGMGGFVLYPYGVTPPSAVADNGAFSLPSGDRSAIIYPNGISLGSAALARGGGSVVCQANNINVAVKLTGTSLFSYLVTIGAFPPAAALETATIRVRGIAL